MSYPYQPWRAALLPASFGGCGFHVEVGSRPGGRRLATHEYPKRDTPFTEDMGRKATRWQITGYCIGPDYLADRDAVIAISNQEGPFTLVHPSFGEMQVHCDTCVPTETQEKGGFCAFEMAFVEAGTNPDASATDDTQAQASMAADASNASAASTVDSGLSGQGGIGSDTAASAGAANNVTPVTTPTASASDGFGGPSAPSSYPDTGGIGSA